MALNLRMKNKELAEQVKQAAKKSNMGVTRYLTNTTKHDGWNAYAIYKYPEQGRPFGTRSNRVITYTRCRHSKWNKPSIIGEEMALSFILKKLIET